MRSPPLVFIFAWLAAALGAQEARPVPAAPQPRVRLDPVVWAAMPGSTPLEKADATAPVPVMLERFVVKGRLGEVLPLRPKEPVFEGKFSLFNGGNFFVREIGQRRVFVGLKPWVDVFEEDARFKHSPAARVNVTLLELK